MPAAIRVNTETQMVCLILTAILAKSAAERKSAPGLKVEIKPLLEVI
jgi:hypothetical protein